MFTRKIGKLLRGKATPLQIALACILGSMLGFIPGFVHGPGLVVVLTLLLVVLNANLFVATAVGGLAKLVSLAVMPVSFMAGRALLDGPTQPVFKAAINTPVLALMGFEKYTTTGGLLLGFVFGVLCAAILVKTLMGFRKKMASLEEGSEVFKRLTSKPMFRLLTFVFIGGSKGSKTYEQLASKKIGNPIRIVGVGLAVVFVALLFVLRGFISESVITSALQRGLEQANGATVDLDSADLDIETGKLVLTGLAMADPNALETDLLRASRVEADVSTSDLLRKRLTIDRLVLAEPSHGQKRTVPGRLVGPKPKDSSTGRQPKGAEPGPDSKTLDDYIAQAEVWRARLSQVRQWIEQVAGDEPRDAGDVEEQEKALTLKDRLARQVQLLGYAAVRADHLIEDAPTLLITELIADGLTSPKLKDETLNVKGQNLSTQPWLVPDQTRVTIRANSGKFLAVAAGRTPTGQPGIARFVYNDLPVDEVTKWLVEMNPRPIQGGTMDIDLNGSWAGPVGSIDLPLNVTMKNTTFTIPGGESAQIAELSLPIALSGTLDDPAIRIDQDQLADALLKAGADKLAGRVRGEAEKLIDEVAEDLTEKLGQDAKDKLKSLLGGG